ncbi:non-ribosomal peptide synthetase [Actinomadura litoris]|uniref:non-ribosomal peptide synthetase n=1 Tax=Actinomadura litoris TaxID=2678616 RepID=UPI001FA70DF2|nr:non-ribosomal peptide synthetase [Actinomadura litoris]
MHAEFLLPEMFAARAAKDPDAPAVRDGDHALTYAGLDARSARLAGSLNARGIGRGHLVAVVLDRSADLVATLLGVLRSGAAYVPISPDDPSERTRFLLEDAAPSLVITSPRHAPGLRRVHDGPVLDGTPEPAETQAPLPRVTPSDAAYVIYTSGSTGRPKGVVVEHGALAAYLDHVVTAYPSIAERALLHSSVSFDMTVTTLYGPLVTGGAVEVVDLRALGADPARADGTDRPGLLKVTPSHLPLLTASPPWCSPTGHLVVGGEALTSAQLEAWWERHPDVTVVNEYGPTEAAVGCCAAHLRRDDLHGMSRVPIGRPTAGTRLHVLDERLEPVTDGASGELYIAGAQLARGYLGRPATTAAAFVADPSGPPGARMYRSGDLVRALPDGRLEYLGRVDDQVKLDGYRIEPGEVEVVLTEHPGVARAVVTARSACSGGPRRLVAHVVPAGDRLDLDDLRRHAADRLPAHMVPADLVPLPELPLTANGKVDTAALPAAPARTGNGGAAPGTAEEETLRALVADLTGAAAVGPDDDFFQLGGTSIGAAKLVTRARRASIPLTVQDVLTKRTVRRMLAQEGT